MTDSELFALARALDAKLQRALVLLERFRDCCHSSTDLTLYDDVEKFLDENVVGTTHRLDSRGLDRSVDTNDPRPPHGEAGSA